MNTELKLELQDTQWKYDYIDHDRNIVRAIVYDEENQFYFVRARRDDEFGKAILIETAGGGVEDGEDLITAIKRELKEELGVQVEVVCKIGVVSDYYNLIHRHNNNNYFLCKVKSFGEKNLTQDEIESFHLSTLKMSYEEAVCEYETRKNTKLGMLIANRELPVLHRAKEILESVGDFMQELSVNEKSYKVIKLLGHGKGGYSYLVTDGEKEYVLKQIHHEPCDYYQFGNKIEAEIRDYERLQKVGISMPIMYEVDIENERILKEYIKGDTIYDYVLEDKVEQTYVEQVKDMCSRVYAANLNIDYFPTNFVVQDNILYYIDYECNEYMEEWNFENWGVRYWSKTKEFLDYVKEHKE